MRILLSRSSTHQVIGGAELSARDITRALLSLGHQCYLVTNIKKQTMSYGLPRDVVKYAPWARYSHSKLAKLFYLPLLFVMLLRYIFIIISFRPDILSPQSREDQITMTFIGKLFNIPVVWRDPGDLVPQLKHPSSSAMQRLNRWLQLKSILKANHIFTLNSSDRSEILKTVTDLDQSSISVVGSNIMFEDYQIKNNPDGSKKITIGFIGNLQKHKGADILISAFLSLRSNNTELWIVGDGQEKDALLRQADGNPSIKFLGYQTDVSKYLSQFDIFVQPSLFEGWGRTVKEAKLFGLSIIGSNIGGIAKQIDNKKTGLLFQPGSVKELAKSLEQLVEDEKLRHKLGQAAQQAAREDGDWLKTTEKDILPIFESALTT